MALLNSVMSFMSAVAPTILAPSKPWHLLILNVFSFIADYGWRVVVFTVLLKIVLSPLDFFQRYKMRKNQIITERLKPTMEKLQKQYGGDKQALSRAQMELNKKEGYSYFSSCIPMIVTLVVFITLWQSMYTIASYMTFKQYVALYDGYTAAESVVTAEYEAGNITIESSQDDEKTLTIKEFATEVGQDVVVKLYYDGITEKWLSGELSEKYNLPEDFAQKFMAKIDEEHSFDYRKPQQARFLWIENIWAPDVPWGDQAILDYEKFYNSIQSRKYNTKAVSGLDDNMLAALLGGGSDATMYNKVMGKLLSADSPHRKVNGYLVLPILVLLLSVASQFISSLQQKRAGQTNEKGGFATSMKVMMFMMPALMLFFSLQYASIFTLYMAINSATSLLLNVLFTGIIKLAEHRRTKRHYGIATGSTRGGITSSPDSPIIHYVKGANPNAGAKPSKDDAPSPAEKKEKRKAGGKNNNAVRRSGRPDPNELMSIDMRDSGKKK
ncbi:MAG: membrane protein insertase YidC [Clostridiales bacterium]|nr:membrane protein insertase YidC [Clostridiales bacterium]